MLKLLRSWPRNVPAGRAYVVDDVERIVIDNYDYTSALASVDDDVLLLEWDIAASKEDLWSFGRHALETPGQVLVAPYRIYAEAYGIPADIWCHRLWDGTGSDTTHPSGTIEPVITGDPACNLFALGMTYLPRQLVRGFIDSRWAARFGDVEFSMWHYAKVARSVAIDWSVHPVHLNYHAACVWKD